MPTPNFVKEIRVVTDGQGLLATSLVDASNAAVVCYTTNTAGVLTNPVTFPLLVSGDVSLWCDSQAVLTGSYAQLSLETLGGVPLNGGFGADFGYRIAGWGQPSTTFVSPASAASAAARYAGSDPSYVNESYDFASFVHTNTALLTTQIATAVPVFLRQGKRCNSITFFTGTQAAVTPTNWWASIHSSAATPALLGQTADQLTAAAAANTKFTLPLAVPFTVASSGWNWVSVMFKAATVPSLYGITQATAALGAAFSNKTVYAQTHGAALTTTAPATITGGTPVLTKFYCRVD